MKKETLSIKQGWVRVFVISLCCWLGWGVATIAASTISPIQQVEASVERILSIMRDVSLLVPEKKTERRHMILAEINSRFDFMEMSKRTLAKNWNEISNSEKTEFKDLFSDLLRNTYITSIEKYTDQKMEYIKQIFGKKNKNRAIVFTKIVKNNKETTINYKLVERQGEWFVYDVIIEGVSIVKNYRLEFSRIIDKESFDSLMSRLKKKNEESFQDS